MASTEVTSSQIPASPAGGPPTAAAPQGTATEAGPPATAEVLTLAEASAFLRVPEVGLRHDVEAGRLPGRLVAGEWRFMKRALVAWLGQTEPSPKSPPLGHWFNTYPGEWNADSEREAEDFIARCAEIRKSYGTVGGDEDEPQ